MKFVFKCITLIFFVTCGLIQCISTTSCIEPLSQKHEYRSMKTKYRTMNTEDTPEYQRHLCRTHPMIM